MRYCDLSFAERKRFYRDVSVYQQSLEHGGQFGVNLDHRKLRTPLRRLFLVPSERLAHAVAQEWGAQVQHVQPSLMHITALCNTVIDDPHKRSLEQITDSLIPYLQSDTIWYSNTCIHEYLFLVIQYYIIIMYSLIQFSFRATEPEDLIAMQQKEWDPIIKWFNER